MLGCPLLLLIMKSKIGAFCFKAPLSIPTKNLTINDLLLKNSVTKGGFHSYPVLSFLIYK